MSLSVQAWRMDAGPGGTNARAGCWLLAGRSLVSAWLMASVAVGRRLGLDGCHCDWAWDRWVCVRCDRQQVSIHGECECAERWAPRRTDRCIGAPSRPSPPAGPGAWLGLLVVGSAATLRPGPGHGRRRATGQQRAVGRRGRAVAAAMPMVRCWCALAAMASGSFVVRNCFAAFLASRYFFTLQMDAKRTKFHSDRSEA